MNKSTRQDGYPVDIPYLKFTEGVTLTNCDREPIHIPGHSQAYGAVVVLDPNSDNLTILQFSDNIATLCGDEAKSILGLGAEALFGETHREILRDAAMSGQVEANPLYLFTDFINGHGPFHITIHTYEGVLIAEIEPKDGDLDQVNRSPNPVDYQAILRQALKSLRDTKTAREYCQTVCEAIQSINGFDRVMVYQFHDDGHGEVIAEVISQADDREPYLGLHYPASDIPAQARALFLLNSIRLMPDARYKQAQIVPAVNPLTNLPLNMSFCVLRGYSQMYTEYLTNMGSRASMSIAIVSDDKLWGLIACHHQSYRWVPYDVRAACELLADVVSLQIADKKARDGIEYRRHIYEINVQLAEILGRQGNSLKARLSVALTSSLSATVHSLFKASGCAIISEKKPVLLGATPSEEDVVALVHWLSHSRPAVDQVWATDELSLYYSGSDSMKETIAGLLALRVSTEPDSDWVLWFRPEASRTVGWAGDPEKPYTIGPLGDRLTPRKSFEIWKQEVRGKSMPWESAEVDGALALRQTIIAHDFSRRAHDLERLNVELALSNTELDAYAYVIAHDLKEPLRGINNYIQFLREDDGASLTTEAGQKLDTMARLTGRMSNLLDSLLHFSQLGRQDLVLTDVNLSAVLADVLESLQPQLKLLNVVVKIPHPMPISFVCDAVQIGVLLTNLIANAAKYNDRADEEHWIEIGWTDNSVVIANTIKNAEKSVPKYVFYVRDNGIGIAEKYFATIFQIFKRLHARTEYEGGTGAGLTICQKVVERHGGRIWLTSDVGVGTTFFFSLGWKP